MVDAGVSLSLRLWAGFALFSRERSALRQQSDRALDVPGFLVLLNSGSNGTISSTKAESGKQQNWLFTFYSTLLFFYE